MSKNIQFKLKKCQIDEIDDPGQIYIARQEREDAYGRLEQIRKEREKMDSDIEKLDIEMMELKKYVTEESFKLDDVIETINEHENIIKEEKMKQEDCSVKINLIKSKIKKYEEVIDLAVTRIENYRPYEEFISEVIASNPRYKNVFDLMKHVEEMACIRKLGSKLKITDPDEDDQKDKTQSNETQKQKIVYNTDFNDARTYLTGLKEADLSFLKKRANISSEHGTNVVFNPINSIYLKTDLERMKDKRKDIDMEIVKRQVQNKQEENYYVINSILHQYRELYFKNNGKLPVEFPLVEDQLIYIFEFYKKTMQRMEVYKNLKSGKMTMDEYLKTED